MCGIVGAFGPKANELAENLPSAMIAIAHRGPDDQGQYLSSDGILNLGHVRLAIQDLSKRAAQPMKLSSPSGLVRGVLAYNGEIYNHKDLRDRYLQDTRFNTNGDTETLLHGLDRMGIGFFEHVEGMYAGAYYNAEDRSLVLFRDPLAIKPLYYRKSPDSTVVFASEIKGLFALDPSTPRVYDNSSLSSYLTFENLPADRTLFENVFQLSPGCALQLRIGEDGFVQVAQLSLPKYLVETSTNFAENTVEKLRAEIRRSVQIHLLSDRPIGVYLSGGIDSALVASLAANEREDIAAFTGFFEEESDPHYDERPLARAVAKMHGIEHHEIPIRPADFSANFDSLIHCLDEPRMGMGSFSQFVVAKEAAKHRRVILAGHGGDELFAGYPLFRLFFALDSQAAISDRAAAVLKARGKEWAWVLYGLGKRYTTGRLQFAPAIGKALLPDQTESDSFGIFSSAKVDQPIAELFRYYREVYLPGLLLVEDKVSMAHSLETRIPLWSQSVVDAASKVSPGKKFFAGELKGLLKEVARPLLPPALLTAPKRGFPTPLRNWFRRSLQDEIRGRLLGHKRLDAIMPEQQIKKLLDDHCSRSLPFALDERRAHRIWILLCLESWSRQFGVELGRTA